MARIQKVQPARAAAQRETFEPADGESHAMLIIGRPDRRVDRLERIVGWFQKHLAEP